MKTQVSHPGPECSTQLLMKAVISVQEMSTRFFCGEAPEMVGAGDSRIQ